MGNYAFYGCKKLTNITWAGNASINSLGYNVFRYHHHDHYHHDHYHHHIFIMKSLLQKYRASTPSTGYNYISLTIPTIKSWVNDPTYGTSAFFADCKSIYAIYFTGTTTQIGAFAFAGLSKLETGY